MKEIISDEWAVALSKYLLSLGTLGDVDKLSIHLETSIWSLACVFMTHINIRLKRDFDRDDVDDIASILSKTIQNELTRVVKERLKVSKEASVYESN